MKFLGGRRTEFNLSFLINIGFLAYISIIYLNNDINFELGLTDAIITSITITCLLIFSLILHELGHLISSSIFNINIKKIKFSCFGGIIYFEDMEVNKNLKNIVLVCFSGPIASLFIGVILSIFWIYYNQYSFSMFPIKETLENSISLVSAYNLFLGIINFVPLLPFDGGRAIQYIFLKEAEKGKQFLLGFLNIINNISYGLVIIFSFFLLIYNSNFNVIILITYSIMLLYENKSIMVMSPNKKCKKAF